MVNEIGRKQAFGLGIETTSGTAVSAVAWIPVDDGMLKHVVEKTHDTNGFGIIDDTLNSDVTKEMSEFSASGNARSTTIGYLLKMALGAVAAPALVETGVYSHAFSRLNTNNHPSATVYRDSANGDERSAYHMVDSLDMEFAIGEYAKFSVTTKGGKISSTTSSPAFITGTGDEPFLVSSATIKVANDLAGLSSASGVCLQNFKFSIAKNIESIFCMGATELSANINKNFNVSGDFEAIYDDNTYRDLFTGNTKQAIQIEITGKILI